MRPRASTLFPVVLVAVLAGMTFWLERLVQGPEGQLQRRAPGVPDFVIEGLKATTMNAAGEAEYTLSAERMTHFPDTDSTEVEAPRLVQWAEDAPPVRVAADRGTVAGDGKELHLHGNVVITRDAAGKSGELRMETRYLRVDPDAEIASTPEHVIITYDGSRLEGVGMEFNQRTRTLELRSQVSGTYIGNEALR
ncbi:MAG: LPS export ABC transporter periplasmic protein LptC [Burkholderiales bacterium]|nr:LPS export ABC transporter periplasmic protein LptC [Burkholderiales bacterium]